MIKLSQFWENAPPEFKHFSRELPEKKRSALLERAERSLFDYIDKARVSVSLDWGCGGGLIAGVLKGFSPQIVLADVSKQSLVEAICHLPGTLRGVFAMLIPDDLSELEYVAPSPDLINATDVIHHFPSYEYFLRVLDIWKKLDPLYITTHTKTCAGDYIQCSDYEEEFISSLLISQNNLLRLMKERGYATIHSVEAPSVRKRGYPMAWNVFMREG